MNEIKIKGGYYSEESSFILFPNQNNKAAIIYGKNGSGKSSIARAFQQSLIGDSPSTTETDLKPNEFEYVKFHKIHSDSNLGIDYTNHTNKPTCNCYVHNEDFTVKNVAFNETGLKTIVMFGEQIDINHKMIETKSEMKSLLKKIDDTQILLGNLLNPKNKNSHLYFKKSIESTLKTNWAIRYQKINQQKTAGKVTQKFIDDLINLSLPKSEYKTLLRIFNEKIEAYLQMKQDEPLETFPSVNIDKQLLECIELLSKNITKPNFSTKEEKIFETIEKLNKNEITNSKNFLSSQESVCPTCFQEVASKTKSLHLSLLINILNSEEANELTNRLTNLNLKEISFNVDSIEKKIDANAYDSLNKCIEQYNTLIKELIFLKSEKILNPYLNITPSLNYNEILTELNSEISKINLLINSYNTSLNKKREYLDELKSINILLARIELDQQIKIYEEKNNYYQLQNKNLASYNVNKSYLTEKLREFQSQLEDTKIALDLINSYLQYIFYDSNRLYLENIDDKYIIKSRGKIVKPNSLSIGEKNIISLCYFFSTMFQNEKISDLFKNKCLLILDDPLSSFDFENKVGVFSFLRYILAELHQGNGESKSLILTHDLDVLYNLNKVYKDIGIIEKQQNNSPLKLYNLGNKSIESITSQNFDEYSRLLQQVYKYVISDDNTIDELNIGNNLRRIIEAYATFNYKIGIEEVTKDPQIVAKFTDHQKEYFNNRMYRLVLNTESHLFERSRQIITTTFKEHFSDTEKRKQRRIY